jgi:hypothetical protein
MVDLQNVWQIYILMGYAKKYFFYHFEEFDLNNLIQKKHWNFML